MSDDNRMIEIDPNYEPMCNDSANTHFSEIIDSTVSRRRVLQGGVAAAAAGFFGVGLTGCGSDSSSTPVTPPPTPVDLRPRIGFAAIPVTRADAITVPAGYSVQVFAPWGAPLTGSMPAYLDHGANTGADQEQQVGSHHDGMHYFPINGSSSHGILAINHEYVDAALILPAGRTVDGSGNRPADEVRKEIAAHGASIMEVKRNGAGTWEIVSGSMYNRRITGNTAMAIRGPVRGSDFVKTKFSPNGLVTRGTLNNCGHGYTPWNTYLTCEENWAGYFMNNDVSKPREHTRYGVPNSNSGRGSWHTASPTADQYDRFNAKVREASATLDYRNEPNGQGWIVEIDPFDPFSLPVKRTALGRFAHEGAVFATPADGQPFVLYSGDDSQNEYIYKYVSKNAYIAGVTRGDDLLDEGTLYVARFKADGSGEWLPLDFNNATFRDKAEAAGVVFTSQADVLVNTRLAADVAGATKMDRPEWGAVDPTTGIVYFTLTNNSSRSVTDTANPRASNRTGHIIRWLERGSPAATTFDWDIFLLAGGTTGALAGKVFPGTDDEIALTADNIHASPDGLWVDDRGLLWIQTDMSGSQQDGVGPDADFGCNQMLAAETDTGRVRRFLAGPHDCEVTGVVMTPDRKTMFVNIQHPGDGTTAAEAAVQDYTSNWPGGGSTRPRSATVIITKDDGGEIGI